MNEKVLRQLKVLTTVMMGIKTELGCISQVMHAQLTLTNPDIATQITENYAKQVDAFEELMLASE